MTKSQNHGEDKELILSLIQDDLINAKLVYGLGDLGLNAEEYLLHLSSTVFRFMGLENNRNVETITECYIKLTEQAKAIDITGARTRLEKLAEKIYQELLKHTT
jgi:hypothetical protein